MGNIYYRMLEDIEASTRNGGGRNVILMDSDLPTCPPVTTEGSREADWTQYMKEDDAIRVTQGPVTANLFCTAVTTASVQSRGGSQKIESLIRGVPFELATQPALPAVMRGFEGPGEGNIPPGRVTYYCGP